MDKNISSSSGEQRVFALAVVNGIASLSAKSTVAADAINYVKGTANVASKTTISALATVDHAAVASMKPNVAMTTRAKVAYKASANLNAKATITAKPGNRIYGNAAITDTATVSAVGFSGRLGTSNMTAKSTVTAIATVDHPAIAGLGAKSTLSMVGRVIHRGVINATAKATTTVVAKVSHKTPAPLAAKSTIAATPQVAKNAIASPKGKSTVAAAAIMSYDAAAILTVKPILFANGFANNAVQYVAKSTLAATANVIVDSVTPSGGATISGYNLNFLRTRNVSSQQGVLCGGEADILKNLDYTGSGGAKLGGHGAFIDTDIAIGGTTASGQANLPGQVEVGSGGSTAAGLSIQTLRSRNIASQQGVLGGGLGIVNVNYNAISQNVYNEVGKGGGTVNGSNVTNAIYTATAQAQGVKLSGRPNYVEFVNGTGGSIANGTAIVTSRATETASQQGVLGGGQAIVSTRTNAFVGGSATVTCVYTSAISGGSTGGSTTIVLVERSLTTSGGSTAAGDSINTYIRQVFAQGGATVNGSSTSPTIYSITSTGGSTVGGVGNVSQRRDFQGTVSGGVDLGGTTIWFPKFHFTGESGFVTGGAGTTAVTQRVYARQRTTTGVFIGGQADTSLRLSHYRYVASGNAFLGGISRTSFFVNDMDCPRYNSVACIDTYPNPHRVCIPVYFFAAQTNKRIPQRQTNRGAYLPAVTVCRQNGYLPDTLTTPY